MFINDEQKKFDKSIIKWIDTMKQEMNISNIDKIEFVNSKKALLIQLVDFITGLSVKCFSECASNNHLNFMINVI